ncbi:hypothetical protein EMCRGX_G016727 [Ephydatia muelleri]
MFHLSKPFSRIAMDIVGPLPKSSKEHKYILVICDYATRYPEAVPLWTCDAEAVAEELVKLFSRVGIPKEILTDQGTSQLLAELYRLLNIHSIWTTPYHPQTDGLVDHFNQTLKAMLQRTVTQEGKDWDRLLPYLLFAYHEVPQTSTGFSPFELLNGRAVRSPLVLSRWPGKQMNGAQETHKKWCDLNAREKSFEVAEKILVLLPTSTNKLLAHWQKVNKWHEPLTTSYWVEDVEKKDELHLWNEEEEQPYEIADQLTKEQQAELRHLLEQTLLD